MKYADLRELKKRYRRAVIELNRLRRRPPKDSIKLERERVDQQRRLVQQIEREIREESATLTAPPVGG